MEEYASTKDILGNLTEEPQTVQDDSLQEDEEELSLPIRIIGWIIAIPIVALLVAIPCAIFFFIFRGIDLWTIIIIIGFVGAIPTILLKGKL
jgi:hypothetical protein